MIKIMSPWFDLTIAPAVTIGHFFITLMLTKWVVSSIIWQYSPTCSVYEWPRFGWVLWCRDMIGGKCHAYGVGDAIDGNIHRLAWWGGLLDWVLDTVELNISFSQNHTTYIGWWKGWPLGGFPVLVLCLFVFCMSLCHVGMKHIHVSVVGLADVVDDVCVRWQTVSRGSRRCHVCWCRISVTTTITEGNLEASILCLSSPLSGKATPIPVALSVIS